MNSKDATLPNPDLSEVSVDRSSRFAAGCRVAVKDIHHRFKAVFIFVERLAAEPRDWGGILSQVSWCENTEEIEKNSTKLRANVIAVFPHPQRPEKKVHVIMFDKLGLLAMDEAGLTSYVFVGYRCAVRPCTNPGFVEWREQARGVFKDTDGVKSATEVPPDTAGIAVEVRRHPMLGQYVWLVQVDDFERLECKYVIVHAAELAPCHTPIGATKRVREPLPEFDVGEERRRQTSSIKYTPAGFGSQTVINLLLTDPNFVEKTLAVKILVPNGDIYGSHMITKQESYSV